MPSTPPDQPFLWTYEYQKKVMAIIGEWAAPDRELFLEDKVDGLRIDDIYRGMDINRVDPFEWVRAVQQEKQEWADYRSRTVNEHGHPDTSCMPRERAYIVRLGYLMAKYPRSDWNALLADPEPTKIWDRPHPSPTVPPKVPSRAPQPVPDIPEADTESTEEAAIIEPAPADEGAPETTDAVEPETEQEPAEPAVQSPTMNSAEVAQVLRVSVQTARYYMERGNVPFGKKIGKAWVMPRAEFMDWVRGNGDAISALKEPKPRKPTRKPEQGPHIVRPGRTASF